jgi:hypothetical protein
MIECRPTVLNNETLETHYVSARDILTLIIKVKTILTDVSGTQPWLDNRKGWFNQMLLEVDE